MEKKYVLTNETLEWKGYILHRIKALKDFGNVKAGDLGGWVEKEDNLSHMGTCWVYGDAAVYKNAEVFGHAKVSDNACVSGYAEVYGNASVYENAEVTDNAKVYGKAEVYGDSLICGNAQVYGKTCVCHKAKVYGYAQISGHAWVYGEAKVYDFAEVYGKAVVYGYAQVCGSAEVFGNAKVCNNVSGVEKSYGDNINSKNNSTMKRQYKVSIDITMSKDIYVDAENEEEAKQKAIKTTKEKSYYLAGTADAFVNCSVTNIVNEDDNIREWLISQLKIKSGGTNSDLDIMVNKAIDYLEKQGYKSVK